MVFSINIDTLSISDNASTWKMEKQNLVNGTKSGHGKKLVMQNKLTEKLQNCSCIFSFLVVFFGFFGFWFLGWIFLFVGLAFLCVCETNCLVLSKDNLPKHNFYQICSTAFFICNTSDTHRTCLYCQGLLFAREN